LIVEYNLVDPQTVSSNLAKGVQIREKRGKECQVVVMKVRKDVEAGRHGLGSGRCLGGCV
jgi:hypothetical protein